MSGTDFRYTCKGSQKASRGLHVKIFTVWGTRYKNRFRRNHSKWGQKIVVHLFFLSAGIHVTKDTPEILDEVRKNHTEAEILYTRPFGDS
jgi:sirohydrochlorin ferrochelatase